MHSVEVIVTTGSDEVVHDLTSACEDFLSGEDGDGLLHLWVPHATAGLAVLETGAGSDGDLLSVLRDLLPADDRWRHRHGSKGHGRDHVLPADVAALAVDVIAHRLVLGFDAVADGVSARSVVERVLWTVPQPVPTLLG